MEELKQSRYEVAHLVEERQKLEQQCLNKDAKYTLDVGKLQRKLKGKFQEVWLFVLGMFSIIKC